MCGAQKSSLRIEFRDEAWGIRDIQFNHPQVGVDNAAARHIVALLVRMRVWRWPDRAPLSVELALEQKPRLTAIEALDKDCAAMVVAVRQNRRKTARSPD